MTKFVTGIVTGAELCKPLEDVQILRISVSGEVLETTFSDQQGSWQLHEFRPGEKVIFRCPGFVQKTFASNTLPSIIRLLEDRLLGYQERLWFSPGQTVEVYVHAPEAYSAKLFRHGLLKERLLNIGNFEAKTQQVPDKYFVETGLDWRGNFSYTIPEHARPGLYSVLLESQRQEPFAIPMVVSTPAHQYGRHSKLLFLVSTNTWQSYNLWGGRSRYRNFEDGSSSEFFHPPEYHWLRRFMSRWLPSTVKAGIKNVFRYPPAMTEPEEAWVFKRLTIRRPFTNCALEENTVFQPFTNHLAAGEWRILAWLEREQLDYDIVSGVELHQNPSLLKHYEAIILSTHSEYWTRVMYEGVKHHHEHNGLWIMNLSGNTMYREIDVLEDGSTRCASLFFVKSCADETQTLGVRYTNNDYGTCAPYKIVAPDHWGFANIPIDQNQVFGGLSLNQNTSKKYSRYDPGRPGLENSLKGMGASGWETDKLSETAPKDIKVIAKGLNKNGGADMVMREPSEKRGGMFSASSLTFGGSLLIDNVASTLVKNIIVKALQDSR